MTEPAPNPPAPRSGVSTAAYVAAGLVLASAVACAGLLSQQRAEEAEEAPEAEVLLRPRGDAPPLAAAPSVEHLVPRVHARHPHDPAAFTQGLVYQDGRLFESTGLVGESSLREVELETGRVLRRQDVSAPYFAEGLSLVGDELVQLTWQDHVAFVYGREDFVKRRELPYVTEGWGLCPHGDALVMSDGSDTLFVRDPQTFAVRRDVHERNGELPVDRLNELECVGDDVYANVWQTDDIVRIDLASGRVEAVIDAGGLLATDERVRADVLNGIAYLPERRRFLITGKLWPRTFEVTFEAPP